MGALETLAIYFVPFLFVGIVAKLLMKRKAVDLADVQAQARPNRRKRKVFLLEVGVPKIEITKVRPPELEASFIATGNACLWHETDEPSALTDPRSRGISGRSEPPHHVAE